MTPTLTLLELLDQAQHGPAVSTVARIFVEHTLLDAADRGLIHVKAGTTPGAGVSMLWALRQAGATQQRDLLTVHLTDAGRDHLGSA